MPQSEKSVRFARARRTRLITKILRGYAISSQIEAGSLRGVGRGRVPVTSGYWPSPSREPGILLYCLSLPLTCGAEA